ncbi:MAG: phosphopyruvate hydratase [Candidatus Pacebacteria bacterium]|nr:phosphopyruvate hydratase [Candidatus Paceibacterota bacterium]
MKTITTLTAREILDSRGTPTIEVTCTLSSGAIGIASVPSGASTGIHEALELRDGEQSRYNGLGVQQAVAHVVGEISTLCSGHEYSQQSLDDALIALDGTPNKSRLGANAILGVSMSFAVAAAHDSHMPLYQYLKEVSATDMGVVPRPMFNVINGGKHADSGLDIQEYMIVPIGFDSITRTVQAGAEVISALKKLLHEQGYSTSVGDEGGFAPKLASNEEALELLVHAIDRAGYTTEQIKIALDVAASSFYADGVYVLTAGGRQERKTSDDMIAWYERLLETYPIISIEDGLAEDDWEGFRGMTATIGTRVHIVGDDLTVTNVDRINQAIKENAINAVLIKLNQIGTVSETIAAIALTKAQGWAPIVSHRSGETTDTFIADLAVGCACPFIKSGSLVRGERVCKYNRLMDIEREL